MHLTSQHLSYIKALEAAFDSLYFVYGTYFETR
jgi:hypothetical protein